MFNLRPKSFFSLVLFGMAMVSLPLLVVLMTSDLLMNRLVRHSSASLYRSVTVSQLSQTLREQTTKQERRLRQYQVLGNRNFYDEIIAWHGAIIETIGRLREFPQTGIQGGLLDELQNREEVIFSTFRDAGSPKTLKLSDEDFEKVSSLADQIYQLGNQGVYQEVNSLQHEEDHAEKILFALASTCLPVTIFLAIYLTRVIALPVKQIDRGLSLLGEGDFSSEIKVTGPHDLVSLGKRLNWLREKLARYEQGKNKFASHISHELKTPLASIYEAAELLNDEITGPVTGGQREVIDILRKNCRQLKGLVANLVSLTMAQAEKTCLNISEFSLDALITEVLTVHKPAILNNSLRIKTELAPLTIRADRGRLRTVLDNLLSNAIKYTPSGDAIRVATSRHGENAIIEVHDSGPGVADEEREQIFAPFFQGSVICPSHIKGSGLGLAIAREYITAHNGSLELVRPEEPGACFRVTIPLACAAG